MRLILLFAAAVILSACVPMTSPVSRIPFPENEYQSLAKEGNAIVKGQAFLKTRGGDIKTAAGSEVLLNPVTSYSLQWYEIAYLAGKPLTEPDPRLSSYVIKQIADGSGRFTFKKVPSGDYFVTSLITWEAATGYQGALQVQGGWVTKRITVKENDEIDIIISA